MAYNLMIVDDSPSMRAVIRKIVDISGAGDCHYLEAGNGIEALERMAGNWIDLVITDLYMPEMDGIELIRRMKADPIFQDTPILVVSTESRPARLEEIYQMGVVGFIHKPFRPEEVRNLIIQCLGVESDGEYNEGSGSGDF